MDIESKVLLIITDCLSVKDLLASSLAGRGSPLDLTEIRRLQDPFTRTTYNLYTNPQRQGSTNKGIKTMKSTEVQTLGTI